MAILNLENLLANTSFATLFITTFFYWIQLGFFSMPSRQGTLARIGNAGLIFANFQLFAFFILRWVESHHFPLSNLYESLLFLAWCLTLGHFFVPAKVGSSLVVGAITAPSALFVNAFASLSLPATLKTAAPLVPALQSNWLMMHVTMMIVSYSMLILGSLFSIAILFLSIPSFEVKRASSVSISADSLSENNNESMQGLLKLLDNLSYRTLGFGFPILTIGILSGAVWANQAWGSYWSWDPKETWALITWVVFAIYFHFRFNQKWSGIKPAFVATVGFVFLWICYLGVNLLGKGLHSYGWFS